MVKVEEAKPFIPVSLWDHTNPFLFSFHSKVVLHTAYHISIDVEWQFWFSAYLLSHQLYCLTHSGNAHFILSPSFNTLLFLQIFISYTSYPPFQPHIYFFSVADSWFQDFPSFQSLVGCFILIWTSLHRFSVCLRTLYLQCIGFGCPFGGHLLSWSAFTLLYCFKIELFCWFKALKKHCSGVWGTNSRALGRSRPGITACFRRIPKQSFSAQQSPALTDFSRFPLSHFPEHNQPGTSTKVNLPNFTEDFDWQGLADLYSVNESLYEHRRNYSPVLDDWMNFWKDVDRMFALLRNLKTLNQTDKLDPLAELGSGVQEEASGAGSPIQEERPPSPVTTGPPRPKTLQESLLKSLNELPEGRPTKPSALPRGDTWVQQLENELDNDGMTFSGNGVTELETHHDFVLRSSKILDLHLQEEEEDIFQAQGYLLLSPPPARPPEPARETLPAWRETIHERWNGSVKPFTHKPRDVQEGSAAGPSHWEWTAAMHCEASQLRDTNPTEHGLLSCIIQWIILFFTGASIY